MVLLTLNTHSLIEENYENKLKYFCEYVSKIKPDVIALQEVNQTSSAPEIEKSDFGYAVGEIPLKEDNHALKVTKLLNSMGQSYSFVWAGIKNGFEIYDEGLAIISTHPMKDAQSFVISKTEDFANWRKRDALVVRINDTAFCTAHLGWWDDAKEPFYDQFCFLDRRLSSFKDVFLMGDFNSPDDIDGEGYSLIKEKNWFDLYALAKKKEGHHTAKGNIAGWENSKEKEIRIDYILSGKKLCVEKCSTVFDNIRGDAVSDHYGVIAQIKGDIL